MEPRKITFVGAHKLLNEFMADTRQVKLPYMFLNIIVNHYHRVKYFNHKLKIAYF